MSTDKAWERFGSTEPYFGVIADADIGRDAFFESGENDIAAVCERILKLDPSFNARRALDFGCGVGRLLIPLSRRFGRVVGVDVSASMMMEARRNLRDRAIENVECTGPGLESVGTDFDLVHSYIVFQHIPPAKGMRLMTELVNRIRVGGWGAIHVLCRDEHPLPWRLAFWIRWHVPLAHILCNIMLGQPWRRPFMQMNVYDLNSVFDIIREGGADEIYTRMTNHGGFIGAFLLFQKRR
jgi:SAM-dependent methyltransferase